MSLCLVLLTGCVNDDDETGDGPATLVNAGDAIPDFSLSGSDGQTFAASSLNGQIYVLDFFDTQCPDCQKELQVLQQIYDKYGSKVLILNVPRSQTKESIQGYWEKASLSMPYYMPTDKDLYYKFAKRNIPRTYVVDANGKVFAAFSDSPIADFETLDSILQQLLVDTPRADGRVNLSIRLQVAPSNRVIEDVFFHNEYTISQLEIYFFDAATKKFFTKAAISGLTQVEVLPNAQYDITYVFDNISLKAGVFDIFAIANYDYGPDEVADEAEFLNLVDSITYKPGIEASIPDKGPVMTNRATSLLAVDLVPWINKDYVLRIEMERVMAKLQIGVSHNTFQLQHNQRKYADINITNYKMVNLNKQYYLFQHKDSLPELTTQPVFALPYNFSDYSDQGNTYVVDPFFYEKTLDTADAAKFQQHYKSWFGDFTTSDFASMPSATNYGYAYILENTAFKTSQKNGYSPGIVFKAAVSPVFVYLYDSSQRVLKEEYRPEYWSSTIYLYKYNFYGSIQAVNVASGLSLDELETYTDAQLKPYGIKQCKFNMGVYETYYTYWIQHRCSPSDYMGPMEYGIVRNNFYKMIITGVNGLGNSIITPDIMRDNYPNSYTDVIVTPST